MRSVIISIVLFIVILLLIFLSMFYVSHQSKETSEILEQLKTSVENGDWASAIDQNEVLKSKWDKDKGILAFLFDHIELDNIQISFSRLDEYINCKDTLTSLSEISVVKMLIEHLPKRDSLTLDNLL